MVVVRPGQFVEVCQIVSSFTIWLLKLTAFNLGFKFHNMMTTAQTVAVFYDGVRFQWQTLARWFADNVHSVNLYVQHDASIDRHNLVSIEFLSLNQKCRKCTVLTKSKK